jgi:hypothetical protein
MRLARLLLGALALLSLRASQASECNRYGDAHGVPQIDLRRYAGVWYTQAMWGTGASSMLWCEEAPPLRQSAASAAL